MTEKKLIKFNIEKEIQTAEQYTKLYKYIILNEFVNHMRLNYELGYSYDRANELLYSLGFNRKRISFEDESGIKQSKNEFINDNGLNKHKPIVSKSKKKEEVVGIMIVKILYFIKDNFFEISYQNGIYNFNLYYSDNGIILVFDSKSIKSVLKEIEENFSYSKKDIPMIASRIKKISEESFIRENTYGESSNNSISIRVEDKRFYKYIFEGDNKK
jgi:hypothetical protein